jgi:hypothetical protein
VGGQKILSRKLLAALCATTCENATATTGCHARTESVTALADELTRLIGTFHN